MPPRHPLALIRRRPACLRLSSSAVPPSAPAPAPARPSPAHPPPPPNAPPDPDPDPDSALSRRFTAMAEDALTASPRRAPAIAAENDFPADLRRRLEARLESAFSAPSASLPTSAPRHVRDLAATPPWTGTESTADSVLRMLVDTHKPLPKDLSRKRAPSLPTPSLHPIPRASTAQRIAQAKEDSTDYALRKTGGLTSEERAEVRHMLRERFLPAGRAVASFQALASLADEKIEDARRRGQFDNLSNRGRPLERDHNAESPFLDTTEYLLNRIIKQQDIVPPWIEKQQELVSAVRGFRERVRGGWRRHVARSIASAGGDLEEQCTRAERYARGEERLWRIEERAKKVEMGEEVEDIEDAVMAGPTEVFRDPAWEAIELSYHKLAIETLNSTTRSYNLMAPEPARKPYYSLARELKTCFRDCAPVISKEIRDRAVRPSANSDFKMERSSGPGGLLEKLGGETAVIHDSTEPNYGFKEFWSGLWGKKRQAG